MPTSQWRRFRSTKTGTQPTGGTTHLQPGGVRRLGTASLVTSNITGRCTAIRHVNCQQCGGADHHFWRPTMPAAARFGGTGNLGCQSSADRLPLTIPSPTKFTFTGEGGATYTPDPTAAMSKSLPRHRLHAGAERHRQGQDQSDLANKNGTRRPAPLPTIWLRPKTGLPVPIRCGNCRQYRQWRDRQQCSTPHHHQRHLRRQQRRAEGHRHRFPQAHGQTTISSPTNSLSPGEGGSNLPP